MKRPDARVARRGVAVAAGVAIAVLWLLIWRQSADSVLTRVPLLDEAWYLREAARIGDEGLGGRPLVMSPLYPLLVCLLGGGRTLVDGVLAGPHPWPLLAAQAGAWTAIGVVIFRVVRRFGPPWVAAAAALLFWLYRPAAIYARTILLEIPLTLGVIAYLALLSRWLAGAGAVRRPVLLAGAAGLCLGLSTLLRAHVVVLLLPGLAVAIATSRGRPHQWWPAVALVLVTVVPIGLAAAHNTAVCGRLTAPVLNGGINLYLGNGPQARGLFTSPQGLDLTRDPSGADYLARRLGRTVAGPCEADRIWRREAVRAVREQPGRVLRLWLEKVNWHLQGWEISQVTPLPAWPVAVPALRPLWMPYGVVVVLGLAGAVAAWPGRRRGDAAVVAIWAASLLLLLGTQSLVFVVSRYRLVLVPILAVLAGLGACRLLALPPAARRRARLTAAAAALVATTLAVPWGTATARRLWRPLEVENEALRWERWAAATVADARSAPARARARELYAAAVALEPVNDTPYLGLARLQAEVGAVDDELATLELGIGRVSDAQRLRRQLIGRLLATGRLDGAYRQLTAFLREHPDDHDALHNLVVLLGRTGRWDEAEPIAIRLHELAPDEPQSSLDLAAVLAATGRTARAIAVLESGLERTPGHADLAANLQRLRDRDR